MTIGSAFERLLMLLVDVRERLAEALEALVRARRGPVLAARGLVVEADGCDSSCFCLSSAWSLVLDAFFSFSARSARLGLVA